MLAVSSAAMTPDARIAVPLGSTISRAASRSNAGSVAGVAGRRGIGSITGRLLDRDRLLPSLTIHLRSPETDSSRSAQ